MAEAAPPFSRAILALDIAIQRSLEIEKFVQEKTSFLKVCSTAEKFIRESVKRAWQNCAPQIKTLFARPAAMAPHCWEAVQLGGWVVFIALPHIIVAIPTVCCRLTLQSIRFSLSSAARLMTSQPIDLKSAPLALQRLINSYRHHALAIHGLTKKERSWTIIPAVKAAAYGLTALSTSACLTVAHLSQSIALRYPPLLECAYGVSRYFWSTLEASSRGRFFHSPISKVHRFVVHLGNSRYWDTNRTDLRTKKAFNNFLAISQESWHAFKALCKGFKTSTLFNQNELIGMDLQPALQAYSAAHPGQALDCTLKTPDRSLTLNGYKLTIRRGMALQIHASLITHHLAAYLQREHFAPPKEMEVELSPVALIAFRCWLYGQQTPLTPALARELSGFAETYLIEALQNYCTAYLDLQNPPAFTPTAQWWNDYSYHQPALQPAFSVIYRETASEPADALQLQRKSPNGAPQELSIDEAENVPVLSKTILQLRSIKIDDPRLAQPFQASVETFQDLKNYLYALAMPPMKLDDFARLKSFWELCDQLPSGEFFKRDLRARIEQQMHAALLEAEENFNPQYPSQEQVLTLMQGAATLQLSSVVNRCFALVWGTLDNPALQEETSSRQSIAERLHSDQSAISLQKTAFFQTLMTRLMAADLAAARASLTALDLSLCARFYIGLDELLIAGQNPKQVRALFQPLFNRALFPNLQRIAWRQLPPSFRKGWLDRSAPESYNWYWEREKTRMQQQVAAATCRSGIAFDYDDA